MAKRHTRIQPYKVLYPSNPLHMSNILLETLITDLDPALKAYVASPAIKAQSQHYLEQLLVNEEFLSTDAFTTTTTAQKHKTITEEIAELDDQQRTANVKLASITNTNRDLIIDVSQDLKAINETIISDMKSEAKGILKLFKPDDKKFDFQANDQLASVIGINSSVLSNIDSILDLLELPTLCKICILQGNYQEALEISVLSTTLIIKYPKILIFHKIHQQIQIELNLMVKNLIKLLNTNLKQNNLIKIFNILTKLDLLNFDKSDSVNTKNSPERTRFLKVIYFNSRYKYILTELNNLKPLIKFNKFSYLKRYIEVYRSDVYHSLSMFFTILNHSLNLDSNPQEDNLLTNQFIKNLAYNLVNELKKYLPEVLSQKDDDDDFKNQLEGLILQIIYLCKSLSRFGQNFENIVVWELCYNEELILEVEWKSNLAKVDKFRD